MKRREKAQTNQASKAATAGFVALAALLLYGALRLSGQIVTRELHQTPQPQASGLIELADPAATPMPTEPPADAVLSVVTPAPDATPGQTGAELPAAAAPTPAQAVPSPAAATPIPSQFEEGCLDLVLIGMDEQGFADLVAVLAIRGNACTLLSIPKNTLCAGGPLSGANDTADVLRRLKRLLGVSFQYYVCFEEDAIPTCVDALGSVTIDGTAHTGPEAFAYFAADGLDEILRASRQQVFLQAFALRIQSLNLLQLWSAKRTLQGNADANLSGEQGWLLYHTLKALDLGGMELQLLPVDSVKQGEQRYYEADLEILQKIIEDLYKNR